jgi:adenylate kinase
MKDLFSILPESPRWLVSKGRFDDAEKILRRVAVDNQRNFDQEAYQKVKEEQERVCLIVLSLLSSFLFSIRVCLIYIIKKEL